MAVVKTCPCGRPARSTLATYCDFCTRYTHPRPATSRRGYGAAHQQARREALARFVDGDLCARCGEPMRDSQALDLDHDDSDRSKYLGLSHSWCNRGASNPTGRNARRPRLPRNCVECGVTFAPYDHSQRYCSRQCVAASRPKKPPKSAPVWVLATCACGAEFSTRRRAKDCSYTCWYERFAIQKRNEYRRKVGLPEDNRPVRRHVA